MIMKTIGYTGIVPKKMFELLFPIRFLHKIVLSVMTLYPAGLQLSRYEGCVLVRNN